MFYSVTKSCPTLCNPMDCIMPDFPVPHHLPEFAQVHVHWIGDSILKIYSYKKISLPRDSGSIGLEWKPGICRFKTSTGELHSQRGSSQPTPSHHIGLRWEMPSQTHFSLHPSPLKEAGGASLNLGSQVTSHSSFSLCFFGHATQHIES